MSEIIYHQPPKRLAALMKRPGGVSVSEALRRAEDGLTMMQGACVASIGAATEGMAGSLAHLRAQPADPAPLLELYAAADQVIGLAGPAKLEDVGTAAYSLCDLIDRFQAGAPIKFAAIQVHLDALNLLRRPVGDTGGPAARSAVLNGLTALIRSM